MARTSIPVRSWFGKEYGAFKRINKNCSVVQSKVGQVFILTIYDMRDTMKVVILAGGFGTRISEESVFKPKPLIDIGGKPILWHIMKYFSYFGFNEFLILGGYKQEQLKSYFNNYFLSTSDVTFDMKNGQVVIQEKRTEPRSVTVLDTGLNTMTGGRIKRAKRYLEDSSFMVTYGDGVSDVDLNKLISFHEHSRKIATITAVMPGGRFGALDIGENGILNGFREKKKEDAGWINGGYMVMEPSLFDYIDGDGSSLEKEPFEKLVADQELSAYKHFGFWQCMDSMKDRNYLEGLISNGSAPWMKW